MHSYEVTVSIPMEATFVVEAEDENDARRQALGLARDEGRNAAYTAYEPEIVLVSLEQR